MLLLLFENSLALLLFCHPGKRLNGVVTTWANGSHACVNMPQDSPIFRITLRIFSRPLPFHEFFLPLQNDMILAKVICMVFIISIIIPNEQTVFFRKKKHFGALLKTCVNMPQDSPIFRIFFPPSAVLRFFSANDLFIISTIYVFLIIIEFLQKFDFLEPSEKNMWICRRIHPFSAYYSAKIFPPSTGRRKTSRKGKGRLYGFHYLWHVFFIIILWCLYCFLSNLLLRTTGSPKKNRCLEQTLMFS